MGPPADPDPTDLEAEGLPELDTQPPGFGAELELEGMIPPRDHPMAVEDRVTPAEQARPETLAERVDREQPGGDESADTAGRLVDPSDGLAEDGDGQAVGAVAADRHGLSAEEQAVHVVDERSAGA